MGQRRTDRTWPVPRSTRHVWLRLDGPAHVVPAQGFVLELAPAQLQVASERADGEPGPAGPRDPLDFGSSTRFTGWSCARPRASRAARRWSAVGGCEAARRVVV